MRVYNHAPIIAQNVLTTAQGWRLRRQRYGRFYWDYRKVLSRRDYGDPRTLRDTQDHTLAAFIQFAANHSTFYRNLYAGIDLSHIRSVEDINILPIVEKDILRQNLADIYTVDRRHAIVSATSGTTGKSMTIYYTREDLQKRLAYLDHFKAQHGFENLSMRRASFTSSKVVPPQQTSRIYWRDNHAMRQRIYSGYHCYGENLPDYVKNLIEFQPHAVDGYPSSLFQVATYMLANGIKFERPPVAVFPTAETLLPHYHSRIQEAFDSPVRDQYSSSEGAPFVVMCRFGTRHYCVDSGVIEDDGQNGILVTGFHTHGTPLIRYRVGDAMEFASEDESCECGSALPVIRQITGRNHDFIFASNGRRVPAVFLSLVSQEFSSDIRAMQFIQTRLGAVQVLVEADSESFLPSMSKIIREKLSYTLGSDTTVQIDVIDHIGRDPSGKFRLIVNRTGGA